MSDPHDAAFHKIFSRPDEARALLQGVLPRPVCDALDWERFGPVPGEFRNGRLQGHRADLLFVAPAAGAPGHLVYLLVEHKHGPAPWADVQLERYAHRVRQRHRELHGRSGPEPAVIPVLIQSGPRGLGQRSRLAAGAEPPLPPLLAPFLPSRRMVVQDFARLDETAIRALSLRPAGMLMALCQRFLPGASAEVTAACLQRWSDLLQTVDQADPGEDIEAICSYVLEVTEMYFAELQELMERQFPHLAKEKFMSTAERLRRLGREEGRQEGRQEGRAELLLRQLAARFGSVPGQAEARIRSASTTELDRWAIGLLTAATLDDVFAG